MCSQFPPSLVEKVLNSDPPWFSWPLSHLWSSLSMLTHDELWVAVSRISTRFTPGKHHDKLSCIDAILDHFHHWRSLLSSYDLHSVYVNLQQVSLISTSDMPRSFMIACFFDAAYGPLVASMLHKSPWSVQECYPIMDNSILNDMPWLTDDLSPWMNRVPRKLPMHMLKACLHSMHPSMRPIFKATAKQSCWHAILHHLRQRGRFLLHQNDMFLLGQLICVRPSSEIDVYTHTSIIHKILCGEYGKDINSEVSRKQHISECAKSRHHKNKM